MSLYGFYKLKQQKTTIRHLQYDTLTALLNLKSAVDRVESFKKQLKSVELFTQGFLSDVGIYDILFYVYVFSFVDVFLCFISCI